VVVEGVPKVRNESTWEQWESLTRIENSTDKHKSTAENLHRGISEVVNNNKYIHIVDDDTIPPNFSITKMSQLLLNNPEVGMVSGLYFCKGWTPPSLIKGKQELKRKLVVSKSAEKWQSCTLDDLVDIDCNNNEVGFVGNGCILLPTEYLKNILPLNDVEEEFNKKGPDWYISYKMREQGKTIKLIPSVLCRHLDENGNEVGVHSSHFDKVKESTKEEDKYLVSIFSSQINYISLLEKFDYIKIIVFDEAKVLFYKKYLKQNRHLLKEDRIEIIQSSVNSYREEYKNFHAYLEKVQFHILHECCLELMNTKASYNITIQPSWDRTITLATHYSLSSNNLKSFITN
jgi:cellulose synthase/poly-beta-1,6-N-acetylglucosamine synthase-like glycosyltransferase